MMRQLVFLILFIVLQNVSFAQSNVDVLMGSCLSTFDLNNTKEKLFLKDFKYLTLPNESKQNVIHPRPNVWKWDRPDELVSFAEKNNILVRLHGPISPQCSKWAKDDNRTIKELETNLIEFMTASCIRYNETPTVVWMDIVNETILTNGKWFGPKPGNSKWENPWLQLGLDKNGYPNYIVKAFEIATEYATNKKLIYNQNGGMQKEMWDKVKQTVLYLRSIGLRVDGIGWQGHIKLGASTYDFVNNLDNQIKELSNLIDWAHDNNLEFHITELDYFIKEGEDLDQETKKQYIIYKKIIDLLNEKSNNGIVTLNFWDLAVREKNNKGSFHSIYDKKLEPTLIYNLIN
tara:strand:+ start:131 stop:1168 length:1038 start_codon:yes stop_codon:yes gene_type:complete